MARRDLSDLGVRVTDTLAVDGGIVLTVDTSELVTALSRVGDAASALVDAIEALPPGVRPIVWRELGARIGERA